MHAKNVWRPGSALALWGSSQRFPDPIAEFRGLTESANRGHFRSAAWGDLAVPRSRTTRYGQRCFDVSGATLWNSLPLSVRDPSAKEHRGRGVKGKRKGQGEGKDRGWKRTGDYGEKNVSSGIFYILLLPLHINANRKRL